MPEICNRCLTQRDARSSIVARENFDYRSPVKSEPTGRSARQLKEWAQEQLALGYVISVDDRGEAFAAISTWHGDPVCVAHLWDLTDAEIRRGYA